MIKLLDMVSRYKPCAEYQGPLLKLFKSIDLIGPKGTHPSIYSEKVWLRIDKRLGCVPYVLMSEELGKLVEGNSVYGGVKNRDVFLHMDKAGNGYYLRMQYQQIIGSRCLFSITEEQYNTFITEIEGML